MAYNEQLAARVHKRLAHFEGYEEKRMFGGVGCLLNGNMACGVHKDHLIVRVGPDKYAEALAEPFAKVFDITGRAMKGWVMIDPHGLESEEVLKEWVQMGIDFALTLPAK